MKSTYTEKYRLLLDLLIEARREAGLTQAELAARLEHPQSFVSKIEHGDRRLDVVELIDYCQQLGIHPVDVFEKLI